MDGGFPKVRHPLSRKLLSGILQCVLQFVVETVPPLPHGLQRPWPPCISWQLAALYSSVVPLLNSSQGLVASPDADADVLI